MKIGHHGKIRNLIIAGVLVLIVGSLAVVLINRHPKATSGPIKVIDQPSTSAKAPQNAVPEGKSVVGTGHENASSELVAPYGTLVSNHRPGQNGSNLTELSQCTTTPGAKCYIKFTQADVVKTLPEKTTGTDGSIFWEWTINDAGLTSGKWSVTAIATLGGQTKSTTDQLSLEVQ